MRRTTKNLKRVQEKDKSIFLDKAALAPFLLIDSNEDQQSYMKIMYACKRLKNRPSLDIDGITAEMLKRSVGTWQSVGLTLFSKILMLLTFPVNEQRGYF